MGINIDLLDVGGRVVEQVLDPGNLLHKLLPSADDRAYHYLRCIDWYGDTVFNYLQMEEFLGELRRIREKASTPEEAHLLDAIERMALLCETKRFLLKFVGD